MVVDLLRRVSSVNLVGWESIHGPGARVTPRTFNILTETEERNASKKIGGIFREPPPLGCKVIVSRRGVGFEVDCVKGHSMIYEHL